MSGVAALASPHRIKRKRHRWRRAASGRTVYAYVGNNPVSEIDPLGLAPGDLYSSMRGAGYAAVNDVNALSIQSGREYGGVVYATVGGYSYTAPNIGTDRAVNVGDAPQGTIEVADYHTHGSYDPNDVNDTFSGHDMYGDVTQDIYGFLGTPNGSILMYDYKTGKIIVLKKGKDDCP